MYIRPSEPSDYSTDGLIAFGAERYATGLGQERDGKIAMRSGATVGILLSIFYDQVNQLLSNVLAKIGNNNPQEVTITLIATAAFTALLGAMSWMGGRTNNQPKGERILTQFAPEHEESIRAALAEQARAHPELALQLEAFAEKLFSKEAQA